MGRYRVAANAALGVDASATGGQTKGMSSPVNRLRGNGAFTPTVLSLLLLVTAEYAGFIMFRRYFRHAHGG